MPTSKRPMHEATAPTSNQQLFDALVRHQTYLLRYSLGVQGRIKGLLDATEQAIATLIRDRLRENAGLARPVEVRRMQALIAAIEKLRSTAWGKAGELLFSEAEALAYEEPIHMRGILATVAPVIVETVLPSTRLLRAIALSKPFEGRILSEWVANMRSEDLRRIKSAIQLGMVAGETNTTIAKRVLGTGLLGGRDGTTELSRRQVDAITRTALMHVANNARDAFIEENADVVTAEQFVATLDSRTTPICRSLDGKVFPRGTGPRPPLHFQCRSLRIAALDEERMGVRPAKPFTEKMLLREFSEKNHLGKVTTRDDLPRGTKGQYDEFARKRKRELTGRVPASTTYEPWLRGQSRAYQDDTLGATKARLFRDGGLTLDKFVAASGSELTLKQLATKHADAFRSAGLDPEDYLRSSRAR